MADFTPKKKFVDLEGLDKFRELLVANDITDAVSDAKDYSDQKNTELSNTLTQAFNEAVEAVENTIEDIDAAFDEYKTENTNKFSSIEGRLATAENLIDTNHTAVNGALATKADLVDGKVKFEQLPLATMTDINEIITNANTAYTETALNIALDELNGEVV